MTFIDMSWQKKLLLSEVGPYLVNRTKLGRGGGKSQCWFGWKEGLKAVAQDIQCLRHPSWIHLHDGGEGGWVQGAMDVGFFKCPQQQMESVYCAHSQFVFMTGPICLSHCGPLGKVEKCWNRRGRRRERGGGEGGWKFEAFVLHCTHCPDPEEGEDTVDFYSNDRLGSKVLARGRTTDPVPVQRIECKIYLTFIVKLSEGQGSLLGGAEVAWSVHMLYNVTVSQTSGWIKRG